MNFDLKITMADPAGNRTAFVEGDVPKEYYAAIGAALLRETDLHAEQAGFSFPPSASGIGRLEMMGGEFCGNAARSFGLWLGVLSGKKAGETVLVEVSGSSAVLEVLLEDGGSWISMPLPERMIEVEVKSEHGDVFSFPAVVLEGITHVVLENTPVSEALAHAVIEKAAAMTHAEAAGAIFVDGDRMTPAVWVKATDSFIWESSCGSGTLAATLWLGRDVIDGAFTKELIQPGGILKAGFIAEGGKIKEARIGGPVTIEAPVMRTVRI